LNLGPDYLNSDDYNGVTIIKTPGMPATLDGIVRARKAGCKLTSHSQIFMDNYPRSQIVGVTGTKGKSTTTSLIHHILETAAIPSVLAGNIGAPPLTRIDFAPEGAWFIHEFSSHQLAEIETSPHIAVLLNIVPEHLDYYATFEDYVAAKENITRFQTPEDFLVFATDYPIPKAIAERSKATLRPFSVDDRMEHIVSREDVPLRGRFNWQNVIAAAAAASLCGARDEAIGEAIRSFRGLPHRLEFVGTYNGVDFYDDSIATVPEATLAALEALGDGVQTLLLGGHERHLDFTPLGRHLPEGVRTVILFPPTGVRIWNAIEQHSKNHALPEAFFVRNMEQAVAIALQRTESGRICLLSPASPSFGTFKDYKERGDLFKAFVKKLSSS
jgi:UDP-N-acetylmuramoylalanine--D-glutamate ligase